MSGRRAVQVTSPPATLDELLARASALEGARLDDVARAMAMPRARGGPHTKGTAGALVERALGAHGGSAAVHDFPELGVELKTIPISEVGSPRESTFVCTLPLADADREEWATSWVRAKLACVLWVPVVVPDDEARPRRIGTPLLWRPSSAQEEILRADFEDVIGAIAIGAIEGLTAREGRWLQVRPKAAHGGVRTRAPGAEGWIATVPRGFYLRARFTEAILRDPTACPA